MKEPMKFPWTIRPVSIFWKTPAPGLCSAAPQIFASTFPFWKPCRLFGNHVAIVRLAEIACVLALALPTGYHNPGRLTQNRTGMGCQCQASRLPRLRRQQPLRPVLAPPCGWPSRIFSTHHRSLPGLSKLGQSGLVLEHCIVWLTPALHSPSRTIHANVVLWTVCTEVALFSGWGSFLGSVWKPRREAAVVVMPGSELQGRRIFSPLNLNITPTRLTNCIAPNVCA